MLLKRIVSIVFLLGCLPPPTSPGKQPWKVYHGGFPSEKPWKNITIEWAFDDDSPSFVSRARDLWYDGRPRVGFWCWCPPTAYSNCTSQCIGIPESGILEVVTSILAPLWPLLLALVVNSANIVILLNLPAYHRGRALYVIQGLSEDADSDSQLKAWEQLIRPLMEEWKTVCVLATLISGAALAMFQIPSFNNNPILPALAYLTLLCTMTAVLLSSIVIIHLGGETTDPQFVRTWLDKFQYTDHRAFWSVWVIVSLPSVWTAWGALVFISAVVFLFWSESGATATKNTALSSSLTASNAAMTLEPSLNVPSFLTAVVLLGLFNVLGVVFSLWKQGRQRESTPLEAT